MNIRLFSIITAGMLSISMISTGSSIAKPTDNNTNLGNGLKFTFQGCTYFPRQEKVVCLGNFRSSSGEQGLSLYGDNTKITNTQGKTYQISEVTIGADFICKRDCSFMTTPLIEGVDYKSIFVFDGVSLPSPKIPLLSIGVSHFSSMLKYRNIKVKTNENSDSNEQNQSNDDDRSVPTKSLTESPAPKLIDRPSTPQPSVNNPPPSRRPTDPVNGLVENLVIRGLNDLFRIPNK